jgi:cyclopropane fatty-acyl-phospholipid synthase-like methyltransferase
MSDTRKLAAKTAASLHAGAKQYRAYVGPTRQYDFVGAIQFRLLTTLGLREDHKLLDLGCGSLRAGRFLMMYLSPGHYCGIEPNNWLIEDAIKQEIGTDMIALLAPRFNHSSDFNAAAFGEQFDFVVAQSIFSHAGPEMVTQALENCSKALKPNGLFLATFIHSDDVPSLSVGAPAWTYPQYISYTADRVQDLASKCGLSARALSWYHPRQTWYALAHTQDVLPSEEMDDFVLGALLRDPAFQANTNKRREAL